MQKRRVWLQMTNAGHTGAADMRKAKDPTPECPILDKLDRYEQTSRRTQAMVRDAMHMKKIRKDVEDALAFLPEAADSRKIFLVSGLLI